MDGGLEDYQSRLGAFLEEEEEEEEEEAQIENSTILGFSMILEQALPKAMDYKAASLWQE
jgi:hypothetical protein